MVHLRKIYCLVVSIVLSTIIIPPAISVEGVQLGEWGEDIRLTFDENRSDMPSIALENNYIHIVYFDGPGGGYDGYVHYLRSDDYGKNWSYDKLINNFPSRIQYPSIVNYNENIHVIWFDREDYRIHYARSTDNGNIWSNVTSLSHPAYYMGYWPDIAAYGNTVHIVHAPDNVLYYLRSEDNGITWSAPIKLLLGSEAINPKIFTDGGDLHLVWTEKSSFLRGISGGSDIFYMKSMDNGNTWETPKQISPVSYILNYSSDPSIAVDGDNVYVVYAHYSNMLPFRTVYYSRSPDSGLSWQTPIQLSINDTENVFFPKIVAKEGNLWTLWIDHRDGNFKMYFKNSFDSGNSWSPDTLLTNDSWYPYLPEIAMDNYIVHVIWSDRRDSNLEIYHKLYQLAPTYIEVAIDIDPDTLNLKSKGRWITAYIEFSNSYGVDDINISTVLLENAIPAEYHPTEIGDHDNDGIPDLMVKFDRSDVEDFVGSKGLVELTINGQLITGESFTGTDTIRCIHDSD